MNRWVAFACAVMLITVSRYGPAAADDTLAAARDLYTAAEYETALQLLDRLRAGEPPTDQARAIDQYRAFCLLALGRANDAEQAIAALVTAEPTFRPSDADASPRVRSAFSEVRRRMWPSLVQQRYLSAKADFDRKNFSAAASGFGRVLEMLADPEGGTLAGQPQLGDIRMLATEFRDLSLAFVVPPPPAPLPASSSLQVVAALPAPSQSAALSTLAPSQGVLATGAGATELKPVFSSSDTEVVPPRVIQQTLPEFPAKIGAAAAGVLEVVIDETGAVESARMRVSVNPYYDGTALDAARLWKYRPATLNGAPVKYRKSVQVAVTR